jgi:hypothetical protein
MSGIDFIILMLAAWRITSIINREEAGKIIRKLMGEKVVNADIVMVPDTLLGELYHCFWCLSVWSAAFCVIMYYIFPVFLYICAISTAAIVLEKKVFNG